MDKQFKLRSVLKELESVLVAFSGGVDSTLLLAECLETLGREKVLAVTLFSEINTENDVKDAKEMADLLKAHHLLYPAADLDHPEFIANNAERCYFCKKHRFQILKTLAGKNNLAWVVDGSNLDDLSDYRPGSQAALELGIKSPLQEAGLTKENIRRYARKKNLPVWDKPSQPCLATRIAYGTLITTKKLARIRQAEVILQTLLGNQQFRVRDHNTLARLEIPPQYFPHIIEPQTVRTINQELKKLGYTYISLDLAGYRRGSMNQINSSVEE